MEEWSAYIKKCEVEANTVLGRNLAFEVSPEQAVLSRSKLAKIGKGENGKEGANKGAAKKANPDIAALIDVEQTEEKQAFFRSFYLYSEFTRKSNRK